MLYPNEMLTNMFRNFSFVNNPFLDALKGGMAAGVPETPNVSANTAGIPEITETLRQNLQEQLTLMNSIASSALTSSEKIVELNLNAARTSIQENATLASQILALNSPADLQTILAALPQATSTKAVAYGNHMSSITADACTEIARTAQAQVTQMTERMTRLIDQASRNFPAGSENVVALTKSAIATAGSGYEQVVKSAEQAAHTLQESTENMVNDAVQRTAKTSAGNGHRRAH